MVLMQMHAKAWDKRAGLSDKNKISMACNNESSFFTHATCVIRAGYGNQEAIFILCLSVIVRCPSGTSVNCQRRKKENEENWTPASN